MPKTDGLTDKQRRFYVYIIAIDGRVRYVGKGTGARLETHLKRSHNDQLRAEIAEARRQGRKVSARRIRSYISEYEALRIERALIFRHHERLTNASLGGRSPAEKLIDNCRESLARLKSREEILREDTGRGTARADLRDKIETEYQNIIRFAKANPHAVRPDGCFELSTGETYV